MGFLSAPTNFLAQRFRNFDSKILGLTILSMKNGRILYYAGPGPCCSWRGSAAARWRASERLVLYDIMLYSMLYSMLHHSIVQYIVYYIVYATV